MRRLFSVIASLASALRSTVSFVWERARDTGAWTLKAVASVVSSGSGAVAAADVGPLQKLEAAMAVEAATPAADDFLKQVVVPPAQGGDSCDRIQRACRDINCGQQPAREDWQALSDLQRDWLQELTPPMRLVVGNVDREALVQHMRAGKALKGVIRCDAESVTAWQHANAIEATIAELDTSDPGLAPAPRLAI